MRTRPLSNRHAADLSDFFEVVQATLNRNRAKGDIAEMTFAEITQKIVEEKEELIQEMFNQRSPELYGVEPEPWRVEREAADNAVTALAAWIWARKAGRGGGDE